MKANITDGVNENSGKTFENETKEMTAQDTMTSRVSSGIDLAVTMQYRGSIESDKGVSENVGTEYPENIISIRRGTSDILSKEGVTSCLYSGVQSWMMSQGSESFNSGLSPERNENFC